ncbi:uncharacterized protein LOC136077972 [Hydra vulgaris]|uniref:Uncharacterized protein LOC136077972 n=1 Tax=Hydra vulgaris TaxID=6087 RepID=A0ABM4BHQ5_HYDVU
MCRKCYLTMKNIETRGNKQLNIIPKSWLKCPAKEYKCIFGKVGRKPSPNLGRLGIFKIWTQLNINLFLESFPLPLNKELISELNLQLNPHTALCICKIYGRMSQPVMIKVCQHSFCSLFIALNIKGNFESEAKCPICSTYIMINSLCSSVHILEMIKQLYIACKICGIIYLKDKFINHECKKDHLRNNCSTMVDDLYKVNKSSHIPRYIEDAVLHVIKQKLDNSKTNAIEFLSGGPRVRIIKLAVVPAIHISLGTYLKFFNMFEDECHLIDIKLAGELSLQSNTIGRDDFDKYVNMHIQSNLLKSIIDDCDNKITHLQETISCEPDKTEEIKKVYGPRILHYDLKRSDKIKELNSLNEANILDKISVPCIQQLDEVLKANHVQRQAYHGKCFVGNHVHTMLKNQQHAIL